MAGDSASFSNIEDAANSNNNLRANAKEKSNSATQKCPRCLVYSSLALVFAVGLAVGILIGIFVIKKDSDKNTADTDQCKNTATAQALSTAATQTKDIQTTSKTSGSCTNTVLTTTSSTGTNCTDSSQPVCVQCETRTPYQSSNDNYVSPFAPLSVEEISQVMAFMTDRNYAQSSSSNGLKANRITHIFLHPVNKDSALAYLDKNGEYPPRYARVHVVRGAIAAPDVMEYKVGPLNETDDNIVVEKLRKDGEIGINRRPRDVYEDSALWHIVRQHTSQMSRLLDESFGATAPYHALLPTLNSTDRLSTVFVYLRFAGMITMRLLPVSFLMHHPGLDTDKWYATDFFYMSQGPYDSASDLQKHYDLGLLRKFKLPENFVTNHRTDYNLKQNMSLPTRPLSDLPPPRTYEPRGPRYSISGNRVSWMDWSFEFSTDPRKGPGVYNVVFKGERIAYEISLQDVTLMYATQTNGAGPSVLSDTFFLLGTFHEPRHGVDCPERGHKLKTTRFGYTRMVSAACVFEADAQRPVWRHFSMGLTDHHLVIRSPMNLGNYDYTLEWNFYLDGHVDTLISASGFLYGSFWDPNDPLVNSDKSTTPFGYRISDYLLGPIHDHAFAFKVDLDILGTTNSFQTVNWKAGDILTALQQETNITSVPGYFNMNRTRYIEHEIIETEGGFLRDPHHPKYYTVVNEDKKNIWGVHRGYRLIPHTTAAEQFTDHVMMPAWEHLKYNVMVTKHKDSEQDATASWYDVAQPGNPFKGVGKMMDGESIRNEDVTLWVTERFLHAPTSEDVPMTLQVTRGFTLKPYNYFDQTPTFDVQGHYGNSDPYPVDPCYEHANGR